MTAWTEKELAILRRKYPTTLTREIAAELGRTERAVYQRARQAGLRKHPDHMAGRFNKGKRHSPGTEFRKGQRPWNAGKPFNPGGRSAETRFKPGRKPQTWQPVGTEKVDKDGVLVRKVSDTRVRRQDWRPVHVLVWEEYHGPLPKGHIVIFKNKNKRDFRIDNLEAVTRAENMRRNTVHRYPKEIARVVQLRGAVNRQINRRKRA